MDCLQLPLLEEALIADCDIGPQLLGGSMFMDLTALPWLSLWAGGPEAAWSPPF